MLKALLFFEWGDLTPGCLYIRQPLGSVPISAGPAPEVITC